MTQRDWLWIVDPSDWYWLIADSPPLIYSSAIGSFVDENAPTYLEWKARVRLSSASLIADIASLGIVLVELNAPKPIEEAVLDAYRDAQTNRVEMVAFRILFNHENRIRSLAGQPSITVQQFITGIKNLL